MESISEIRESFWDTYCADGNPAEYFGSRQNYLPCEIRCAFVDYVDYLARCGAISETLAFNATL